MSNKTYAEADLRNAGLEYFRGDMLATNVWITKYALKINGKYVEKTPDDTIRRIATEIHKVEEQHPNGMSFKEIYKHLKGFKDFIFAGSILFGLGNPSRVSLGNCFFINNQADSYGGIFQLDESMAQLMKRRGGVGVTLEHLRPETSAVHNSAQTSTGAVSFMERYSNTTREVAQDGRRGALMISMHVHHPDIMDFINAKNDLTKVTGANVSVKMTDEFMKAAKADQDFYLHWPVQKEQPTVEEQVPYEELFQLEDGTYIKRVKAKKIWDAIVTMAHKNAEPGVLFWDNIIKESPADMYSDLGFETQGTNPCIVGDTLIATADGRNAVSIRELAKEGKDVPVYSTDPNSGQTQIKWGRKPRLTKKDAEVWKLTLDDGSKLLATPDHRILTSNLNYKELKDLKPGESIIPFYSFESNGYRQISRVGSKMIGGNFRNRRQYSIIHEFHNGTIDHKKYDIHHIDFNSKNDSINNLLVLERAEHQKIHSDKIKGLNNPYHNMTDEWKFNFASHPGVSNPRFSGYTNEELINEGKRIFNDKGKITRKLWVKAAKRKGMPVQLGNEFRFGSFTNFKNQVAENHKVQSIEFVGHEDVYNITVDDNHNYHVITSHEDDQFIKSSGICVKNCGEVPLSPFDSCRLGSINVFSMVKKPFTQEARIDWPKLAKVARFAQRVMDDIVLAEEVRVQEIIDKIQADPEPEDVKHAELKVWEKVLSVLKRGRRTGVGILGLGDAFAAMGIQYGSEEATKLGEEIQKVIAVNSYRESVTLAKERGHFEVWDADKEAGNPFLVRVISNQFDNKEYEEYLDYGRRNIANLSIAPTGSLAIVSQTTSSIEPVFKIFYRRRRKVNPGEKGVKVSFVDQNGDSWEEYNVIHYPFIDWYHNKFADEDVPFETSYEYLKNLDEESLDQMVEDSPWSGSEAHTIDYLEKINMQGGIQKWTDHSISVTHNLPKEITVEETADIYLKGWEAGCKGITIYREGSRSGVLLTGKEDKKEDEFPENHAPKRPRVLEADYFSATAQGKKFAVIIGLYKGKPYECFAFENPPSDKNTRGKVVKLRKGHYKFINGEFEIDNLELAADKVEERSLTLTVSALLRHGAPIKFVVDTIKKIDDKIVSFSSAVRRYLSRYIESEGIDGESCPHCSDKLITESGCIRCVNPECGYERCS